MVLIPGAQKSGGIVHLDSISRATDGTQTFGTHIKPDKFTRFQERTYEFTEKINAPRRVLKGVACDMSNRASLDQYQIPLRSLGHGRRKPIRTFSTSSNSGHSDFGGSFTETADEEEDRLSTDEAPLIHKHEVRFLAKILSLR
jgi:hypothetical protein